MEGEMGNQTSEATNKQKSRTNRHLYEWDKKGHIQWMQVVIDSLALIVNDQNHYHLMFIVFAKLIFFIPPFIQYLLSAYPIYLVPGTFVSPDAKV